MRPVLTAIFLAFVSSLSAADLQLVRIWPSYRTAESFHHVSEYFTGKEANLGQTVLRTQTDARDGYYFLTRIKNPGPEISDAQIEIKIILPDSPKPRTYHFTAAVKSGSHVLEVGLTGKDWPSPVTLPVAWELRVTKPGGEELAKGQSFVWALPEKKKST